MKALRYALGGLAAAAALYASFRGVSHQGVRDAMHAASLSWMLLAVLSTLTTLTLVTWRSGLLIDAAPGRHWAMLWNAVLIGQAVNIVFPLRFGEAARVANVSNRTGWPVGRIVMALVLERFCDVGAFSALVLLLAILGRLPAELTGVMPASLLAILLTLAVVIAGVWALARIGRAVGAAGGARGRAARWVVTQADETTRAWRAIMRGRRAAGLLLLTGSVVASSALTNFLVFRAFALDVPPAAAFLLLVVLQLGTAVVSVPGNIGVFQYLTVLTLGNWHVDGSTAMAASLMLHLVSLGPRVALGGLAAASWGTARGR